VEQEEEEAGPMAQFGASNKCATCDKPVFFSEQVRALDKGRCQWRSAPRARPRRPSTLGQQGTLREEGVSRGQQLLT
jgi:hypothetical protein